jgi:hypothetical protein
MSVKYALPGAALFTIVWLSCLPVDPLPVRLSGKPVLQFVEMAPVADPVDGYRESVHLRWTFDRSDNDFLNSFTLLRKLSTDSAFDVFAGSRLIPADTADFFDELELYVYPRSGADPVLYRLYTVDTLGRSGDTSEICTVSLAPQPVFTAYDVSARRITWESWIHGSVSSWCAVWHDEDGLLWTSPHMVDFPFTDKPAVFSADLPDSIGLSSGTRLRYALYIKANDAHSLKIGAVDVP